MLDALWSHVQTVTAIFPALPTRGGPADEVIALPLSPPSPAEASVGSEGGGGQTREGARATPSDPGHLIVVAQWQPRRAPAAVVIHGVGGSSDDAYVMRAARALFARGFHVLRVNQRGSGRGIGKAALLYHAGMADDVAVVEHHLRARDDVDGVYVLGFSLGGHVALSHAAALPAGSTIRAVAAVSAPVDLAEPLRNFEKNRKTPWAIYENRITTSLVEKARALLERPDGSSLPFTREELDGVKDLGAFDALVTCRCHGFADVPDYHDKVSVGPRLSNITVPALLVHADDDPIVPVGALKRAAAPGNVDVVILPRGGHVGFVERPRELVGTSAAVARAIAHFERHS